MSKPDFFAGLFCGVILSMIACCLMARHFYNWELEIRQGDLNQRTDIQVQALRHSLVELKDLMRGYGQSISGLSSAVNDVRQAIEDDGLYLRR